ncbi:MAG: hypothetical protein FJ295_10035 [Planctomycetes bacterium]|nr:hypothetical protein [Planctomycetota bacterium]
MSRVLAGLAVSLLMAATVAAQPKVEVVVSGLDNPCGVAVQPETGHLFVADSGAGRVVRIVDGKIEDVITGYPLDVYGKGPMYNIGPLGLVFLDKDTLVVGDGGFKDGEECLRVYAVPAAGKPALKYEDSKAKAGPLAANDQVKGEGNLYGLVATKAGIFVTCNGDDTKGWIAKCDINGQKIGELKRFIATKEAVEVDAPVAITLGTKGELVVGQMGEINVPGDSLLSFYNPNSGKLLLNLKTGLYDIASLAYHPKNEQLYAIDFAWMKTEDGGLFRLERETKDGQQAIKPVKVAGLDKPTAMAFNKAGELFITVIGPKKDGEGAKSGQLLKISSGL